MTPCCTLFFLPPNNTFGFSRSSVTLCKNLVFFSKPEKQTKQILTINETVKALARHTHIFSVRTRDNLDMKTLKNTNEHNIQSRH